MKFLLTPLLFFITTAVNAQSIFKGTVFEMMRSKKGDSVYNKWMNDYTWFTQIPSRGEEVLSCKLKKEKKAKYTLIVYLWQSQVQAITIMNFGKKETYGKYKGELPLQLKWGLDWTEIERLGFTGTKSSQGVSGQHESGNFLFGFEELDYSKGRWEYTEEAKIKLMEPKKLDRITFNAFVGPQYLLGIRK